MIQPSTFVGSLAIFMAFAIGFSALGPIHRLQMLRAVKSVGNRFGEPGVRIFLALVASLLLVAGVMILKDLRPAFAAPQAGTSGSNRNLPVDQHKY